MVAFQNSIVSILTVPSGATTGERVQIGYGAHIQLYNANNVLVGNWDPNEFDIINPTSGGEISIQAAAFNNPTLPTIFFKSSPTSDVAFINAFGPNPQLGMNSAPYTDPGGAGTVYERIAMFNDSLQIGIVEQSNQAALYVVTVSHDYVRNTVPYFKNASGWTNITTLNGWGWFGTHWNPPQALARPDGTVLLRGLLGSGTTTANTVFANIPATDGGGNNLRPTFSSGTVAPTGAVFATMGDGSTINKIYIEPNGNMVFPSTFVGTSMSLDGIVYQAYVQ